jgi:hypothetical protein
MIDVRMASVGPCVLAVGVLITVGALLSRFGVRTFISPSHMDQRPELLALGPAFVLAGIGAVRAPAFLVPAMALFVLALVLMSKSVPDRSKNGSHPG